MQIHNPSSANFNKAIKAANRFISFRPRSEFEIREKLLGKFSPELVDRTAEFLKSQNKVNDTLFAKYWVEKRMYSSLRSSNFIRTELVDKGLDPEIIDEAIEKIDDERVAIISAKKTVKNFKTSQYQSFKGRVIRSLIYRGFDYTLSSKIAKQLWKETSETIT